MTTCPTCGQLAQILTPCPECSDLEELLRETNELADKQKEWIREIHTLLSVRPGETVVDAAKRWRETVEKIDKTANAPAPWAKYEDVITCGRLARELLGD